MIEEEVLQQFSFLQSQYYFPSFETKIWRDEYYIKSRKANIEFSVYIQMESEGFPCISIINHAEKVEFDNNLSPTNNYDLENLEKNNDLIHSLTKTGEESIKKYIAECANILKRHPQVLYGDVSKFEKQDSFSELKIQIYHLGKDGKVIKDGTRTVKNVSELNNLTNQKATFFMRLLDRIKNIFV